MNIGRRRLTVHIAGACRDTGFNGGVAIDGQSTTWDINAEGAAGGRTRIVDTVYCQRDGITVGNIASYGAGNCNHAARFGSVEDIVCCDRVDRDRRRRYRRIDRVSLRVGSGGFTIDVARTGRDAGFNRRIAISSQCASRHIDAERAA